MPQKCTNSCVVCGPKGREFPVVFLAAAVNGLDVAESREHNYFVRDFGRAGRTRVRRPSKESEPRCQRGFLSGTACSCFDGTHRYSACINSPVTVRINIGACIDISKPYAEISPRHPKDAFVAGAPCRTYQVLYLPLDARVFRPFGRIIAPVTLPHGFLPPWIPGG